MKVSSYNKWVEVGYQLFSEEGHEGIQVERLARITGLNKSGFYHFFGNRDVFFDQLMQHHLENTRDMVEAINMLKDYYPSFIKLLVDRKTVTFFQMQLTRNRNVDVFLKTHNEAAQLIFPAVIPLWCDYVELPQEIAQKYWAIMRDTFNSRITLKNYSFSFIAEMSEQIREVVRIAAETAK